MGLRETTARQLGCDIRFIVVPGSIATVDFLGVIGTKRHKVF